MDADDAILKFTYEILTDLSGRLLNHAGDCVARKDVEYDMRAAALAINNMASLRLRLGEIAVQVLAHPTWDAAAVARDLRQALSDAEKTN
jgi:hypothetical protein